MTFRSDELHRTHPLRPLLAELARIDWVDRTELPRLTRGQAEELAAVVLGRAPERGLADAIYERAQGNPLFTEELLACAGRRATRSPTRSPTCCCSRAPAAGRHPGSAARRERGQRRDQRHAARAGHRARRGQADRRDPARGGGERPGDDRGRVLLQARADPGGGARRPAAGRARRGAHRFAQAIDADPALVPQGRADIEKAHHWYSAHNTTGALAGSWRASVQASNAVAHAERLMLLDRVLELWEQVPDAAAQIGADHVRVLEEAVTRRRGRRRAAPRPRVRGTRAHRA